MFEDFLELLFEEGYRVKRNSSGVIIPNKLIKNGVASEIPDLAKKLYDWATLYGNERVLSTLSLGDKKAIVRDLISQYWEKFKDELSSASKSESKIYFYDPDHIGAAMDIFTNTVKLYDRNTKEVLEDNYEAVLRILSKEVADYFKHNLVPCKFVYNPSKQVSFYSEKYRGKDLPVFNSYKMPLWMQKKIEEPKPPQFFFDFVEHFLPDEDNREYWLKWMKVMMAGRNNTMACYITDPGTGKNTATIIKEQLVGPHNFFKPRKTFFNSQFNSEIFNKKLVYFDEVCISLHHKEILKELMNDSLSIERKGLDPIMTANHCNFVLANNIKNSNRVDMKDRRFSVFDATNTKLLDVFSEEVVTEFVNLISDPNGDEIAHIGHWIIKNVKIKGFNSQKPFIGKTFIELSQNSLWDWEKFLVEKIKTCENDEYTWSEIKSEFSIVYGSGGKFGGTSTTEMFLSYYVDAEGHPVATTEQKGTDLLIKPTKKYKPKKKNEAFEEFDDIELPKKETVSMEEFLS